MTSVFNLKIGRLDSICEDAGDARDRLIVLILCRHHVERLQADEFRVPKTDQIAHSWPFEVILGWLDIFAKNRYLAQLQFRLLLLDEFLRIKNLCED